MDRRLELFDNGEANRFQFGLDQGDFAKIEYIKTKDKRIYLTHTEVPKGYEGQGIGSRIIGLTLEHIKAGGWTLIPLCPFVAKYLQRHPEWKALVMKGINIP